VAQIPQATGGSLKNFSPAKWYLLAPLLLLLLWGQAWALRFDAPVAQVLDGDSLVLADGRQVRLIGVNAPELGKDGTPDEPFAREAHAFLAALVAGQRVTLVLDEEHTDRYGRLLAHVYLPGGRNVQEKLLRAGLAFLVAVSPNLSRLTAYREAEEEARRARRGVWNHPAYAPVAAERVRETGFRFVAGTVRRVGKGPHAYYFDLAPRFTLVVERSDWERYFAHPSPSAARLCHTPPCQPEALLGKSIVARGWIAQQDGKLHMRLRHPAMLTLRN
jgi:endonuclease YncB( thermonuclease family)